MEQNFNKRFLSWRDIDDAIERLAINITNSGTQFAAIGGLPRGGLIPAVMLSHTLKIPYVPQAVFMRTPGNLLLVDDICDTGKTLKPFENDERIYTVTIHYKLSATTEPNFFWKLAPTNEWIVYPWERKDSKTIQDYKTC